MLRKQIVARVLVVLTLALLVSCSGDREAKLSQAIGERAYVTLGVHQPLKTSDAVAYPGHLVLHKGCVMLRPRDGFPPEMVAWPAGFTAPATYTGFHVVDGKGRTVASNGDRVVLGGGPIAANAIRNATGGNLPPQCLVSHLIAVDGQVQRQGKEARTVSKVVGLRLDIARKRLSKVDLKVWVLGSHHNDAVVAQQDPRAGTKVPVHSTVAVLAR
ncbi:MAG: PASTA domain-containing protein [Actinomycetota bacterium]|nr:PASTA domain-containing protein [Actinomycetota bacterium]